MILLSNAQKISPTFEKETFEVYPLKDIDFNKNREFLKQNFKSLNREAIFSFLLNIVVW